MKKIYTSVIFLDLLQTNFRNFQYRKCITMHVTLPRLKMAQWFWRTRFLKVVNVFSLFCNYLPLGKGQGPSFEQTWIPFNQGCFVPSFVEIGPVVLENKIFKICHCIFAFS